MAVVKTDTYYYKEGEFTRRIRVLKDGLFRIKLPPFTAEKLSYDEVYADTQAKVIRKYNKALKEYKESQTVEQKVILYEIKYNAVIWDKKKCILREEKIPFSSGLGLTVSAGVFIERKIETKKGEYTFKYDRADDGSDLPYSLSRLDLVSTLGREAENKIIWTPERHKFFEALHKAMTSLILKIHHFEDSEKLLNFIDSGKQLMGGNEHETKRD